MGARYISSLNDRAFLDSHVENLRSHGMQNMDHGTFQPGSQSDDFQH